MTVTNRRVRLRVRYPGDGGIRVKEAPLFSFWGVQSHGRKVMRGMSLEKFVRHVIANGQK